MFRLQRLNSALRAQAGIERSAARNMHVESEPRIVTEPARYNVRKKDGSIDKYTVYDNTIHIAKLQKVNGQYKMVSQNYIKANQPQNL